MADVARRCDNRFLFTGNITKPSTLKAGFALYAENLTIEAPSG